jgi:regulator of RNase E activity RraA
MEFKNELEMFKFMEENFYAAALSDILDEMNFLECAVSPHAMIKPLYPQAIAAGRARTALNAPMKTGRDDPYKLAIELMDSMQAGEVAVVTSDKPIETGIMGELSATAMRSRGVHGCLVDGYTRDARKIIKLQFPTFARGVSPIDTTDRVAVVEYDCRIIFGNRQVNPGQIVFADLDGIVFIPKEIEMEVIQEAATRVKVEQKVRQELGQGKNIRDVWDKYHVM